MVHLKSVIIPLYEREEKPGHSNYARFDMAGKGGGKCLPSCRNKNSDLCLTIVLSIHTSNYDPCVAPSICLKPLAIDIQRYHLNRNLYKREFDATTLVIGVKH